MMSFLQHHATLVLFVCICLGYLLGNLRIGRFRLGGVCGTLLVALVFGQAHVIVAPGATQVASALFIFSLGYLAGPQLVASLRREDLRLFVFPLIEVVLAAGTVVLVCLLFGLGPGAAAGLYAGGTTQSAALGTAAEALERIGLSPAAAASQQADLAAAYSLSYLCGLVAIIVFSTQLAPSVMRVDLARDAARLLKDLRRPRSGDATDVLPDLVGRVYRAGSQVPPSVSALQQRLGAGVLIVAVLREGSELGLSPECELEPTDLIQLAGDRDALTGAAVLLGEERPTPAALRRPIDTLEVMVTRRALRASGDRLEDLTAQSTGVVATEVRRSGVAIPSGPQLRLRSGDVVTVFGSPDRLQRAAEQLGKPIDRNVHADLAFLGAGLALGSIVGLLDLRWGPLDFTIGTGGGILLAGLFFGWLRTKRSTIGAYAPAAAEVIKELGLTIFIGVAGLTAAPQLGRVLERFGVVLPVAAVVITLLPATVSLLIARRVLRMPVPLALGAVVGQQCSSPAISALQQRAGNTTPLLSYIPVYAISNVVLPLVAPLIVSVAALLEH